MLRRDIFALLISVFVVNFPFNISQSPYMEAPPPMRITTLVEVYTEYDWWLLAWADNELACQVLTENQGSPELAEVRADCAAEVYELWIEQPLCSTATYGGDLSSCDGYYLYFIGAHEAEREVVVELPPATANLSVEGCSQQGYETLCPDVPVLKIGGIEPLPEHSITQVHFEYRGRAELCPGAVCEVRLWPTTMAGERISFCADSSYGDSSQVYEARLRMKPNGDGNWQLDILSRQLTDHSRQAMSLEWKVFPPLGANPAWLAYPADAAALASGEPYQYLAGRLIDARIE
jgi:hypothetical protein